MIKILQNKILLDTAAKLQVYIVSPADLNNEWFHPIALFGLFCVHQQSPVNEYHAVLHHSYFRVLHKIMKQENLNAFCMLYIYTRIYLSLCCNLFSCLLQQQCKYCQNYCYSCYLFIMLLISSLFRVEFHLTLRKPQ